MRALSALLTLLFLAAPLAAGQGNGAGEVTVHALAVAETPQGLAGSVATIQIRQEPGSGLVLLDTQPFAQVDMQGSARLATRVAGAITGIDTRTRDFSIVVRGQSALIGGPSAGAVMTIGAIAALEDWDIDPKVYMTGTITPDGAVGPVGGVAEKASAAARRGASLFLYPAGEENVTTRTAQGILRLNMSEHCEALGITCKSVLDAREALPYFTGQRIDAPDVPEVATQRYDATLRPLALTSIEQARLALNAAREDLEAATLDPAMRADLGRRLAQAASSLDAAENASTGERPYTATSQAFIATLLIRITNETLHVATSNAQRDALNDLLTRATDNAADALANARNATPTTPSHLQAIGAAQQRAKDATDAAALARQLAATGAALGSIEQAAYAIERAETSRWWLRLTDSFDTKTSTHFDLDREALAAISDATTFETYARATLESAGATRALADATESIERARTNYHAGLKAAALFDALESQTRASLALETPAFDNDVPAARVERARQQAERALALARAEGIEPVLAATQYEFAGQQASRLDQTASYDLARVLAGAHSYSATPQRASSTSLLAQHVLTPAGAIGIAFTTGLVLGPAVLLALRGRKDPQRHDIRILPPDEPGHRTCLPPQEAVSASSNNAEGPPRPAAFRP